MKGAIWGKLLQAAIRGEPDKVPKGWKTVRQIADETGQSLSHTGNLVRHAAAIGVIEHKEFRILTETGRIFPIPHYKPK